MSQVRALAPLLFGALLLHAAEGYGQQPSAQHAARASQGPASAAPASPPADAPAAAADSTPTGWLVPSLHALGLMSVMRGTEAVLWPAPFADTFPAHVGARYADAFTLPPRWDSSRDAFEWDGDRWYINVVGHGLFGSELYLRARACHKPAWQALLFTAAASTLWEYGFEANGVRPSALDLGFTPLSGLVLGEARYQAFRAASALPGRALRWTLRAVLDPLGELSRHLGAPC